jgi:hypothetical protein
MFEAARRIAQGMRSLALVVIDAEREPAEARALLGQITDRDRRLPVLWVGAAPSGSGLKPDVCLPADGPNETLERARAGVAGRRPLPTFARTQLGLGLRHRAHDHVRVRRGMRRNYDEFRGRLTAFYTRC